MTRETKLSGLARYAWFVVGWNIVVILWGVFLRASKSGDGCGQHWLTCQGEIIPSAPELKTIIEYSHRLTSFLAFVSVLILVVLVFRTFGKGTAIRKTAIGSLVFILTEALVGAGLVLTGNTAEALTAARPFWMAGHLLNTFILLASLTITARYAGGAGPAKWDMVRRYGSVMTVGALAVFVVGMTGSIAALAHMIFPSGTLGEGLASDLSPTSNILLRLRLLHPITAILTSVFLVFLAGWLRKESGKDRIVVRWSNILSLLVLGQIALGSLTLFTRAPIVMQVGHLFLADAIWLSYVMLAANFLSRSRNEAIQDPEESGTG